MSRRACLLVQQGTFSESGLSAKHAELRGFSAIFRGKQPDFSATQTAWRRERDSNPRYGFPYSGFQDRLFQPLTHPSAVVNSMFSSLYDSLVYFPNVSLLHSLNTLWP